MEEERCVNTPIGVVFYRDDGDTVDTRTETEEDER